MTPDDLAIVLYLDGVGHGQAMRKRGFPFDHQSVADNPDDPFFVGYSDGYLTPLPEREAHA